MLTPTESNQLEDAVLGLQMRAMKYGHHEAAKFIERQSAELRAKATDIEDVKAGIRRLMASVSEIMGVVKLPPKRAQIESFQGLSKEKIEEKLRQQFAECIEELKYLGFLDENGKALFNAIDGTTMTYIPPPERIKVADENLSILRALNQPLVLLVPISAAVLDIIDLLSNRNGRLLREDGSIIQQPTIKNDDMAGFQYMATSFRHKGEGLLPKSEMLTTSSYDYSIVVVDGGRNTQQSGISPRRVLIETKHPLYRTDPLTLDDALMFHLRTMITPPCDSPGHHPTNNNIREALPGNYDPTLDIVPTIQWQDGVKIGSMSPDFSSSKLQYVAPFGYRHAIRFF